jgi:hypothetical protein
VMRATEVPSLCFILDRKSASPAPFVRSHATDLGHDVHVGHSDRAVELCDDGPTCQLRRLLRQAATSSDNAYKQAHFGVFFFFQSANGAVWTRSEHLW